MITVTGAAATMPLAAVGPDHSIGLPALPFLMQQELQSPPPVVVIHPIADAPPVDIPPEMTADLTTGPDGNIIKLSRGSSWKSQDRKHKQVTIDDLPSDYYSSDDSDRSSDDDLN